MFLGVVLTQPSYDLPYSTVKLTCPQTQVFRDRVRLRGPVCKVTSLDTSMFQYVGLNACHIIPRSHAQLFVYSSTTLLIL